MVPITIEELAEKIKNKLQEDDRLAPYALKARVYENGKVQVQGIVDVLTEKRQAEEVIWAIAGVKAVENDITVCTDGAIDDEDVAFEISEELQANPEVPDSVGAVVHGGAARLVGRVTNASEAKEAIDTAAKARGVRDVRSELAIEPEPDAATITSNITTALVDELGLVPGKVRVEVEDGVVTLGGDIPEEQVKLAEGIASRQDGVKQVENL